MFEPHTPYLIILRSGFLGTKLFDRINNKKKDNKNKIKTCEKELSQKL